MRVFKTCLIVVKRRIASLLLYFIIFLLLSIIMPMMGGESQSMDFAGLKPNFTVINRDGDSPLSAGLVTYLGGHGTEVILEDKKDVLQDATFFRAIDIIIILPQGLNQTFHAGDDFVIETVVTTETAMGYYAESLLNQYFNQARIIKSSGEIKDETLISMVLEDLSLETRVEVRRFGTGGPIGENYHLYMRFVSYILIVLIILCVANIMTAFRRPDIMMRNLCSPIKPRNMSGQQILCNVLVSISAWLLMTALGLIFHWPVISAIDGRIVGLILLNSLTMTIIALSLASMIGPVINNPTTINGAANFGGLGLCFLGGIFVPLDLFGDAFLAVARFTPVYWYNMALDQIVALTSFGREALLPIWQAMLTQLLFAAAFFSVALAIGKHLSQSEKYFSSVRTEIE
ncbi:MAG: ABC transporter permease [Lachnospiraceae bacterium]|nr:ABC transporter permease [Lachnospiraceae bacterium]